MAVELMANIILVDDNEALLPPIMGLLKAYGHEVSTFPSAEEVVKQLDTLSFDVVVTDLSMEPLTGLDLLREVMQRDKTVPVIVLTAYATLQTALEAKKDGAFDFMTKPFPIKQLVDTIGKGLEWREKAKAGDVAAETLRGDSLNKYVHSQIPSIPKIPRGDG